MEALKTFQNLSEADKISFFKVLCQLNVTNSTLPTTPPNSNFNCLLENLNTGVKRPAEDSSIETSPSADNKKKQKTLDCWLVKKKTTTSNINNEVSNASPTQLPTLPDKSNNKLIDSPVSNDLGTSKSSHQTEQSNIDSFTPEKSKYVPFIIEKPANTSNLDDESPVSVPNNRQSMVLYTDGETISSPNTHIISTFPPVGNEENKVEPMNNEKSTVPSKNKRSKISVNAKLSRVFSNKNKRLKLSQINDEGSSVSTVVDKKSPFSTVVDKKSTVSPLIDKRSKVSSIINKKSTTSSTIDKRSTVPPIINKNSTVSPTIDKKSTVSPTAGKKSVVSPTMDKKSTVSPAADKKSVVSPTIDKKSIVSPISINSRRCTRSPIDSEKQAVSSGEKSNVSHANETSYNLRSKRKSPISNSSASTNLNTINNVANNVTKFEKNGTDTNNQIFQDSSTIFINNSLESNVPNSLNNDNNTSPHLKSPGNLIANKKLVKKTQNAIQKNLEKQISQNDKLVDTALEKSDSVINAAYEAFSKFRLNCSNFGLDANDILQDERMLNFLNSNESNTDTLILIGCYKNKSGKVMPVVHTHESESELIQQLYKMQKMLKKKK